MDDAIFLPQGELFMPSPLARGPWTPDAQHGGAPSALLARAVERFGEHPEQTFVARLTIELLRPVPISPLAVRARMLRPGKKVQIVEASLYAGETEVARCTALRLRRADVPLPASLPFDPPPRGPEGGKDGVPPWAQASYEGFHNRGVEHRFVGGSFLEAGPATDWIRLRVPLVAGEETSPLCRVAAAADFGNGVSWVLSRADGYGFINPDLTVTLHRHPEGEWVCLDAVTEVGPHGVGMAVSRLYDERGSIGRAVQCLLIDKA